ncbi:MAG: hypothetical protein ACLFST_07205 [Spirochaetia bacterium]
MSDRRIKKFDESLKKMFDEIDDYLEDSYGNLYPLHPARPDRGKTSNKEHDGLFNIGASFSAGFGSRLGRGYIVDVHMVTLHQVPDDIRRQIEDDVVRQISRKLPAFFPDRDLDVEKDGTVFKIYEKGK